MTLMSYPSKPMLKNQAAFSFAAALQNVGVPGHSIQEGRLTRSSGSSPLSGGNRVLPLCSRPPISNFEMQVAPIEPQRPVIMVPPHDGSATCPPDWPQSLP